MAGNIGSTTEFLHGVGLVIANDGYVELRVPSTAIIGIVATAEDADPEQFPLDQPVLITDLQRALAKAGVQGTLAETLYNIQQESRAAVIVVRTAEGATEAETIANIVGKVDTLGNKTGLKALEMSSQRTGLQPRIFGVPGWDQHQAIALELFQLAERQYGFAYASCSDKSSISNAILYRDEFAIDTGMLFYGDVLTFNAQKGMEIETFATAKVLGLRSELDKTLGWHHSISNHPLNSVTGLTKELSHQGINGYSTDVNLLNEKGISCFIQDSGFRTWGNRTTSAAESSNYFEVSTRTGQQIGLTAANLLKNMTQDRPMTPAILKQYIERVNRFLSIWQAEGRILGGNCFMNPDRNGTDALMSGKPAWDIEFTPSVPMENPNLTVRLTDKFVLNALSLVTG